MDSLFEKIKAAGVVGAGGAGFPTHLKFNSTVDTFIANGAECEPLLYKDKELMHFHADEVYKGMRLATVALNAGRSVLGIKAKNKEVIGIFKGLTGGSKTEIFEMGDYYPAGDEYILVYEATGRLIPYGGYPVDISCVVSNVETLMNIALANIDVPVTEKFITITGAVKNPMTLKVPIGISLNDLIEFAGGLATDGEVAALDGGAMMGSLVTDFSNVVTKTSGGYIILPKDHYLIRRRSQTIPEIKKIGQSACDQCTYCTEFCPRYLLGYQIEPHKVMRSLGFAGEKDDFWGKYAVNCCECNLCSLFACPEDLDPKQACVRSKTNIKLKKLEYIPPTEPVKAHPMQAHRKISIKKLTRKLGLVPYDQQALYNEVKLEPDKVVIPLQQHIGAPSEAKVKKGDKVTVGQLIGEIPDGAMGANIHASINGTVTDVSEAITIEA